MQLLQTSADWFFKFGFGRKRERERERDRERETERERERLFDSLTNRSAKLWRWGGAVFLRLPVYDAFCRLQLMRKNIDSGLV